MNQDIRISVGLLTHPKFRRFRRCVGDRALEYLVSFWSTVAQHAPEGKLTGWNDDDIADAAGWESSAPLNAPSTDGQRPVERVEDFVSALEGCGFLDRTRNGYVVHDWEVHQPWACGAKDRSEAARKAGKASADARKQARESSNAPSTDFQRPVERSVENPFNGNSTPSPSPSPRKKNPTGSKKTAKGGGKKTPTQAPDAFPITERMRQWLNDKNVSMPTAEREAERFLAHHGAKGTKFRDWQRAFQTWVLNGIRYGEIKPGGDDPEGGGDDEPFFG